MAAVLMYNLDNEKGRKIRLICMRLKIRAQVVPEADFGQPVGALVGLAQRAETAESEGKGVFRDEMLVFVNLDSGAFNLLLAEMRRGKAVVPLKAVLTPTNVAWTSAQLHDEIAREHAAMQAQRESAHKEE